MSPEADIARFLARTLTSTQTMAGVASTQTRAGVVAEGSRSTSSAAGPLTYLPACTIEYVAGAGGTGAGVYSDLGEAGTPPRQMASYHSDPVQKRTMTLGWGTFLPRCAPLSTAFPVNMG